MIDIDSQELGSLFTPSHDMGDVYTGEDVSGNILDKMSQDILIIEWAIRRGYPNPNGYTNEAIRDEIYSLEDGFDLNNFIIVDLAVEALDAVQWINDNLPHGFAVKRDLYRGYQLVREG